MSERFRLAVSVHVFRDDAFRRLVLSVLGRAISRMCGGPQRTKCKVELRLLGSHVRGDAPCAVLCGLGFGHSCSPAIEHTIKGEIGERRFYSRDGATGRDQLDACHFLSVPS